VTTAEIWKKLTPSQRATLLDEAGLSYLNYGDEALYRAGLKKQGHLIPAPVSGAARHALGRKGLLDVGGTIAAPTTAAGFHTPRRVTPLGRSAAEHGVGLLRGTITREIAMAKKKTARTIPAKLPAQDAIETVRRLMRSSGFDEEAVYGGAESQLHFASREEGDVLEGRADPGTIRFARDKAKEVEAAVPGTKARVEVVDEWVSIAVTLPPGTTMPRAAEPEPPPTRPAPPPPPSRQRASLRPGDEIEYTNFTVGGSFKNKAIVTWDHGKSVEARTLSGERIRLERAADGSLRRFT
jgi:hypothetical protein